MNMPRYEVTDKQWEKIKDLLPPKKTGRPFKNLLTSSRYFVGNVYSPEKTRFTNVLLIGLMWIFLKS